MMLDKAKLYFKTIQLKNKQRAIDKQYERDGLTDEVLDAQVELNMLRHELDIADSKNQVHEKFVQ